jgi:hypothetical protein
LSARSGSTAHPTTGNTTRAAARSFAATTHKRTAASDTDTQARAAAATDKRSAASGGFTNGEPRIDVATFDGAGGNGLLSSVFPKFGEGGVFPKSRLKNNATFGARSHPL